MKEKFISFRAPQQMRGRFEAACKYKGWTVQEAMRRILDQWLLDVEAESRGRKRR